MAFKYISLIGATAFFVTFSSALAYDTDEAFEEAIDICLTKAEDASDDHDSLFNSCMEELGFPQGGYNEDYHDDGGHEHNH